MLCYLHTECRLDLNSTTNDSLTVNVSATKDVMQKKKYNPPQTNGSSSRFENGGRNSNFRGRDRGGRGRGFGRPHCQICGKLGHLATTYYNHFNQAYQAPIIILPIL